MRRLMLLAMLLSGCGSDGGSGSSPSGGGGGGGGGGTPPPATYFPPWAAAVPTTVLAATYNGGQTADQNGAALKAMMQALMPGQMLEIGTGTWSINSYFDLNVNGTAGAPIWIVAAAGATPVITRPNASQNVINIGYGAGSTYLCLRGLEVTGGSDLIKCKVVSQFWIDQCHIHHGDGVGIGIHDADTSNVHITRNHIHDPGGAGATAEGMYLGANNGVVKMSQSVIALNHVHDTNGTQGDGIELKQGSWGNWIVENEVHDANYPCITVYGTGGQPQNIIERNTLYRSNDNTLQVQGEAIVRNNLIMDAAASGFHSHDHQGSTTNLQVVHNTIITSGKAANLVNWNSRASMVFANNALTSQGGQYATFGSGSTGVTIAGNVNGTSLAAYMSVTWTGTNRNAEPAVGSPLIGAGSVPQAVPYDLTGALRVSLLETGAFDKP